MIITLDAAPLIGAVLFVGACVVYILLALAYYVAQFLYHQIVWFARRPPLILHEGDEVMTRNGKSWWVQYTIDNRVHVKNKPYDWDMSLLDAFDLSEVRLLKPVEDKYRV